MLFRSPLAVKAGLNGVMMGNFLTTLGNEPETDREMFEELGLNVARQPDNAANPRPDNRSGWLAGQTPDVVEELLGATAAIEAGAGPDAPGGGCDEAGLKIQLWDPSTQLRYRAKRSVPPRPDGAPNRAPAHRHARRRGSSDEAADTAPSPVTAGWGD